MLESTVLIAAAPAELKPLVRSWAALKTEDDVEAWQHPSRSIFALCGGMGAAAATRAFARARAICIPTEIISVGWAGALQSQTEPGTILHLSHVLDTVTGELHGQSDTQATLLLTTPRVADREEKYRLKERYPHAVAVDMEAATLVRLCLANKIPFSAIKAISDSLDEEFPDMNPFITERGKFRIAAFALKATLTPGSWPMLVKFGKQASLAADNLAQTLRRELGL